MKKTLFIMMVLLSAMVVNAQEEEYVSQQRNPILPGPGHINLEVLLKEGVNTKMDISKLTLSELRVLRNAPAARQGYCFMAADLRGIYSSATTWYDSLMWVRFEESGESEEGIEVKYSKAETAFIKKIQAREKELLQQNFKASGGKIVNTDNLINPYQVENIDPTLVDKLGRYGFAIVPQKKEQLFHIYEKNDYSDFPNFVTTDLYLQAFHMYFDCLTREVEENTLNPAMVELRKEMYQEIRRVAKTTQNNVLRQAAERNAAFFAIALSALNNQPLLAVDAEWAELAAQEVENINTANDIPSIFNGYVERSFPYSLYRPRGHYTRTETLKRYFRGMMWLQNAPFNAEINDQLVPAALIGYTLANNPKLLALYERVNQPITYLFGAPDNITIIQLNDEMKRLGFTPETLAGNGKQIQQLREAAITVAKQQTRIMPKDIAPEYIINFMPQRYMPDAEVLQEMQDSKTDPSLRPYPKGLDVMAALGVSAAERILLEELKEQQNWSGFTPALQKMKQRMKEIDWKETVSTQWINSLEELCQPNAKYPYFMKTPQWDKKNLNSALASWAELKHDAILYAKQPMGAECGAGGPPEPIVKGYVEPNVRYWQLAITLINATEALLKQYNLATEKTADISGRMREEAQFLLNMSNKELNGEKLTNEEYGHIECIGSNFENITLDLMRQEGQNLYDWKAVEGADRSIAVVADVFTASHRNIPIDERAIIYEAVGPAYEIYVVVEIEGTLYLTRGAVFSYREFHRAMSEPRWTDEEWQEQLKSTPRAGEPDWMQEIMIPLEVEDNETYFYSSGC